MELTPGKQYAIKLTNGSWVKAIFNGTDVLGGYRGEYTSTRSRTHFSFTNIATGRHITIKSKRKIREVAQ